MFSIKRKKNTFFLFCISKMWFTFTERQAEKKVANLFRNEIIHTSFRSEESPSSSSSRSSLYRASANDCICPITGGGERRSHLDSLFWRKTTNGINVVLRSGSRKIPFFLFVTYVSLSVLFSPPFPLFLPPLVLRFLSNRLRSLKSHVLSIKVCFVCLRGHRAG